MTTTTCPMKIMNFSLNNEKIRYKFPMNLSANTIDTALRREFNLVHDVKYSLVDTMDNTIVDISTLIYLQDESDISIRIKPINKSMKDNPSHSRTNLSSFNSTELGNSLTPDFSSYSDNNEKFVLSDLSSTSSTSEGDSKREIHYMNTIPSNGSIKLTDAQSRKKQREMRIICNRRINYFLQKYVHIDPMDCKNLIQQILIQLKIELHDLYNFLKFLRHHIDFSSLKLNKENILRILSQLYQQNYLKGEGELFYLSKLFV